MQPKQIMNARYRNIMIKSINWKASINKIKSYKIFLDEI